MNQVSRDFGSITCPRKRLRIRTNKLSFHGARRFLGYASTEMPRFSGDRSRKRICPLRLMDRFTVLLAVECRVNLLMAEAGNDLHADCG